MSVLFYRSLLSVLAPVVVWHALKGGTAHMAERFGRAEVPQNALWIHAASNGEATSARPLLDALLDHDPEIQIVFSTNSLTGRAMVAGWSLPRVTPCLAPLDFRWAVGRFVRRAAPRALLLVENELWPNRQAALAAQGLPVLVAGGRMSAGSARFWSRFPALAAKVLAPIRFVSPQDEASGERFADLGVTADRIGPVVNLKAFAPTAETAVSEWPFDRAQTLLAASTHEGEEDQILTAFTAAHIARPDLRLILAPRHPRRGDAIADLLRQRGLRFARRSAGEPVTAETEVYLADTMGEMDQWYRAAGVTFVGGSLVPKGGHTPFEPAAHHSAILHGPYLDNFAESYAALSQAQAALRVDTADELSKALVALTPHHVAGLAKAAWATLGGTGDLDALRDLAERVLQTSKGGS